MDWKKKYHTEYERKKQLEKFAFNLRANSTKAEIRLWYFICSKQILGVIFFRQKPIGNYIVDFCAPSIKLIIEVDGGQHYEENHQKRDQKRDRTLQYHGYKILRFTNLEVYFQIKEVLECIYNTVFSLKKEQYELW